MADLIAQGPHPDDRWRRALTIGSEAIIGRATGSWQVDWDDRISRQHVLVRPISEDRVEVEQFSVARNPIFFRGVKRDRFTMGPGEHFVIGRTTFTLAVRPCVAESSAMEPGVTQHAFAPTALRNRVYRDAAGRIEVLSRLPELISGSTSDSELLVRVTGVLMQATPSATAIAILHVGNAPTSPDGSSGYAQVDVLHYDSRQPTTDGPRPSGRLARQAIKSGESVLHLWGRGNARPSESRAAFTVSEDVDWAFGVPVPSEACPGWVIYVTGQLGSDSQGSIEHSMQTAPNDLQDDVKFAELVATTLGNLRQMRLLQKRQAGLSRFFAPIVMEALAGRDTHEVLSPREAEISVLFCDLRGFSRRSEEQSEKLMELLERVSEALGIMTRSILRRDGVIGDFHGDAAMGFWGWPLADANAAQRACVTALEILDEFRQHSASNQSPLGGFRCGIGIASGLGVAGRIGTSDQVKVTAFGPVVNLASRLEGMTKSFSAEILVDETTAAYVREQIPPSVARVRRLARVRPAGIQTPLMVHQLLPPASAPGTLSDQDILTYEAALDKLLDRRWDEAFEKLHQVPASDRVKDFLTVFIASHGRIAPDDWDGVISLPK